MGIIHLGIVNKILIVKRLGDSKICLVLQIKMLKLQTQKVDTGCTYLI